MSMLVSRIDMNESLERRRIAGMASSSISGLVAIESWVRERLRGTSRKTLQENR